MRRPPAVGDRLSDVLIRHHRRFSAAAILLALLSAISASTAPASSSPTHRDLVTDQGIPTGLGPGHSFPTPIQHAFVVVLENAARSTVLQNGPFLRYLAHTYATASQYYASCHPSAPNYLAMTSGKTWQCGSDAWKVYDSTNLADLLDSANRTWGAYLESMPTPCDTNNSYPYAVRHNPFVYYSDIVLNTTQCRRHDLNLSAWSDAVNRSQLPDFGLIVPNLRDDGHDTSVATADRWLKGWLSPQLNASWFSNSVFFIVYDESVNDTTGFNGSTGGHIYFSAVSPFSVPGGNYTSNVTHYNLLTTIEWLLGLGSTGHNDSATSYPPMRALFRFPVEYSIHGVVSSQKTGVAISGAAVSLDSTTTATTNSTGAFDLRAGNGSHELAVRAAGYFPWSTSVSVSGADVNVNPSLRSLPAPQYAVSGHIRATWDGEPVGDCVVKVAGGQDAVCNSTGFYSLSLANGSYNLTAAAPFYYAPLTKSVVVQGAATTLDFLLANASGANGSQVLSLIVQATPGTAWPNQTIQLRAEPSGGTPPYLAAWNFGDGTNGSGLNTSHAYATTGTYLVSLVVHDSGNGTITDEVWMSIVPVNQVRTILPGPVPGEGLIARAEGALGAAGILLVAATIGAVAGAGGVWRAAARDQGGVRARR